MSVSAGESSGEHTLRGRNRKRQQEEKTVEPASSPVGQAGLLAEATGSPPGLGRLWGRAVDRACRLPARLGRSKGRPGARGKRHAARFGRFYGRSREKRNGDEKRRRWRAAPARWKQGEKGREVPRHWVLTRRTVGRSGMAEETRRRRISAAEPRTAAGKTRAARRNGGAAARFLRRGGSARRGGSRGVVRFVRGGFKRRRRARQGRRPWRPVRREKWGEERKQRRGDREQVGASGALLRRRGRAGGPGAASRRGHGDELCGPSHGSVATEVGGVGFTNRSLGV